MRRWRLALPPQGTATPRRRTIVFSSHNRSYGADNRADDRAAVIIAFILAVELESLLPRGRAEIVFNHHEELMCIVTFGGVVELECLAFKKHTVVVDKHRAIDELESAFAVILEVADCVECVGIVALRLYLEVMISSDVWKAANRITSFSSLTLPGH